MPKSILTIKLTQEQLERLHEILKEHRLVLKHIVDGTYIIERLKDDAQ